MYKHITSRCFINFPFRRLQQELDFVLSHRIQPEIGLEGDTLYTATDAEYREVAAPCTPLFSTSLQGLWTKTSWQPAAPSWERPLTSSRYFGRPR